MHVPCRASGRPKLRTLSGERLRGGEAADFALLQIWAYAGTDDAREEKVSKEFPFTLDLRAHLRIADESTHAAGFGESPHRPNSAPRVRRGYARKSTCPDEMIAPDGSLRPYWQPFVSMLDELGPSELGKRWEHARRLIHRQRRNATTCMATRTVSTGRGAWT